MTKHDSYITLCEIFQLLVIFYHAYVIEPVGNSGHTAIKFSN